MDLKNIAIIGPRGNVGSAIISELLKSSPHFNITAITRPTSTYTPPTPSSPITVKTAEFASLDSITTALVNQDAAVCCVSGSATQFEPMKLITDAAIKAGVKVFFADEFVGNLESEHFKILPESYVGAKRRVRKYLEEVLSFHFRFASQVWGRGGRMRKRLMLGPAGFDIKNKRARIYGEGNNTLCWTPLSVIATAAVNMLRNPLPILNKPTHICGVENLTQLSLLSALQAVLETKFSVEYIDVKQINNNALIALERGEVDKAMKGLTVSGQFYVGDSIAREFLALCENERMGVVPMSVESAVRDAIAGWGMEMDVVQSFFRVEPCEP
ncbi:NAD(P)-binding protein [Zopfia rhizophila CBS 207.26]|uniref:NAD(P)-binding protein n=1 Tax=Zopfia rhizophila CBS 207.26 TaxID=1314779 RepID=A0A6A6E0F9_9PEZI|nr:NAD(P)-binding protein [Zopfia rhizophila CBS 207.26]